MFVRLNTSFFFPIAIEPFSLIHWCVRTYMLTSPCFVCPRNHNFPLKIFIQIHPSIQLLTEQITDTGAASLASALAQGHPSVRLLVLTDNPLTAAGRSSFAALEEKVGNWSFLLSGRDFFYLFWMFFSSLYHTKLPTLAHARSISINSTCQGIHVDAGITVRPASSSDDTVEHEEL